MCKEALSITSIIIHYRLIEDTFTIDEVTEMLDGLLSVVRGEVETELINTSHTNVLLVTAIIPTE